MTAGSFRDYVKKFNLSACFCYFLSTGKQSISENSW